MSYGQIVVIPLSEMSEKLKEDLVTESNLAFFKIKRDSYISERAEKLKKKYFFTEEQSTGFTKAMNSKFKDRDKGHLKSNIYYAFVMCYYTVLEGNYLSPFYDGKSNRIDIMFSRESKIDYELQAFNSLILQYIRNEKKRAVLPYLKDFSERGLSEMRKIFLMLQKEVNIDEMFILAPLETATLR